MAVNQRNHEFEGNYWKALDSEFIVFFFLRALRPKDNLAYDGSRFYTSPSLCITKSSTLLKKLMLMEPLCTLTTPSFRRRTLLTSDPVAKQR